MRYCWNCGSEMKDGETHCSRCGASVNGPQQNDQSNQRTEVRDDRIWNDPVPSGGPRKSNKSTIIIIAAIAVALILILAMVLPNLVSVEETADYNVKMKISNVSIDDSANGFQYAEKQGGCLHAYLVYSCNGSAEVYHELGWCPTDGSRMIIPEDKRTASFDVNSQQSKITISVFLMVVTKTNSNNTNHYDYVDLHDITGKIQGETPSGTHNYGVQGVKFTMSDITMDQITMTGDSQPKGTTTLTFVITKK